MSTYAMCCELSFPANDRRGAFSIYRVKSIEVQSSWAELTDTAKIEIPRVSEDFEGDKLREVFAVGDPIVIRLGYDGDLKEVFAGFITNVSAGQPIAIECEDLMWKVKQEAVNFGGKNLSLPKFLRAVLPAYEVDATDMNIGTVRFARTTMGEVMTKMKDEMGIYFFADAGIVVAGKVHSRNLPEVEIIVESSRKNELKYSSSTDKKVKVTTKSTLASGKKIEATAGDDGGSEVKLSFYDKDQTELKAEAEEALKRYKFDGYTGHIECFADIGDIGHGYTVQLVSVDYPDRNGRYYVDKVEYKFSDNSTYSIYVYLGRQV